MVTGSPFTYGLLIKPHTILMDLRIILNFDPLIPGINLDVRIKDSDIVDAHLLSQT